MCIRDRDYSLCCVYAKRYSKEEIVILKEKYIETTGSNLDLVLMSTTMIDWIAYNDIEKRIAFLKTSHSIIEMYSEEINKMTIIKIVPINNVDSAVCDILAKQMCIRDRLCTKYKYTNMREQNKDQNTLFW